MQKNGCVKVGNTDMYYVAFGEGKKNLVVLPGLSDGLWTVKGKAMLLARFTKPKNYDRFCKNAYAILNFDARPVLSGIKCPTYIMSGDCDNTVGNVAPYELKAGVEHSEMLIFQGLGHGLFEEDKDFYNKVFEFCER